MKREPAILGRRIAVRGATGSGKTTLARRLGRVLDLPVVELDAIHWRNADWIELPTAEFRGEVEQVLVGLADGWVCDGNYTSKLGDFVMRQADSVVWLNLPWRLSFWRLLQRTVRRAVSRELLWGTNRESWRLSFLSKNSILLWSFNQRRKSPAKTRRDLQSLDQTAVFELRSSREVRDFLARVESAAGRQR